jgi:hypothetical protein
MNSFPFINGPFNNQTLIIDMIDTTRGPVAPEEVRMEVVRTRFGIVPQFVEEGGERYVLEGGRYVWKG